MRKRPDWDTYFLNIATDVATRATCLRRCYGAVITFNNIIVSTGYCGAPKGLPNCIDVGTCRRQELNIPSGERYEFCHSVHAEVNAIIQADPKLLTGATIYVSGFDATTMEPILTIPCVMCSRIIKNSGITNVVYYDIYNRSDLINVVEKKIIYKTADELLKSYINLYGEKNE